MSMLRPLSEVAELGGQGRSVPTAYSRSDVPTQSGRRALWYHKTDVTQSMRAYTDSFIEPKPSQRKMAEKYWAERSRLLVPEKLRLPLTRVVAVMLDSPAIGSRWVTCQPYDGDDATSSALCVYLNSTAGLLALLGGRDNRVPEYPQFSIDTLSRVSVPYLSHHSELLPKALAAVFERLKDETLLPLPEMDRDPARRALDEAVIDAWDLDPEWVAEIRRALSEEPSITGKRFGT